MFSCCLVTVAGNRQTLGEVDGIDVLLSQLAVSMSPRLDRHAWLDGRTVRRANSFKVTWLEACTIRQAYMYD